MSPRAEYPGAVEERGKSGAAKSNAEETEYERLAMRVRRVCLDSCRGSSSSKEACRDEGGPEGEELPLETECEEEARDPNSRESLAKGLAASSSAALPESIL